jgi:hypothetical protein
MSPLVALVASLATAAPPTVRYVVKAETKTWQPIALEEVEKIIEAQALTPITKAGEMHLVRSGFADLKSGDYTLLVNARYIDEAEKISVYLTFGPGQRTNLPSFNVSGTASLGHRPFGEMQKIIEELTRQAAGRLATVLGPRLAASVAELALPPVEAEELPWEWGNIDIPEVKNPTKLVRDLAIVSNDNYERQNAVRELAAHVTDQPVVRQVLERCLLFDPSPEVRIRCVQALEPMAHSRVETQRLLLYAMRQELDHQVLAAIAKIAGAFVGLSRKETVATWLELLSSETMPGEAASSVAQLLAKEGDVPNLDLAVTKCLNLESLAWQKRHACAQWLLPVIPEHRRISVIWRYLQTVAVWDNADNLAWEEVVDHGIGRSSEEVAPEVAELLLSIATRPSAGRARYKALYEARRHPKPTAANVARILPVLADQQLTQPGLRTLFEMVDKNPELRPVVLAGLKKVRETMPFLVHPSRMNPEEELDKSIASLQKERRR